WRGELLLLELQPSEVAFCIVERVEPTGVLADDERPRVCRRQHPDGMRSGRHVEATEHQLLVAVEGGGLVGAGTPDASVLHERAEDRPPPHGWPTVDDGDVRAVHGGADALMRADPLSALSRAGRG